MSAASAPGARAAIAGILCSALFALLSALPLVGLQACREGTSQCDEATPCGFGEVCVDGLCASKGCATSAQCGMEEYCDGGACTAGCAADSDCFPGDACDAATSSCKAAECRDTQLDCDFKEYCDYATGDCYEASGYNCSRCADDSDCGGNGNLCLSFGANGSYCSVSCEAESDCPAGFTCSTVTDSTGNPISAQCITYCWLYEDVDGGAPPFVPPVPETVSTTELEASASEPGACEIGEVP